MIDVYVKCPVITVYTHVSENALSRIVNLYKVLTYIYIWGQNRKHLPVEKFLQIFADIFMKYERQGRCCGQFCGLSKH